MTRVLLLLDHAFKTALKRLNQFFPAFDLFRRKWHRTAQGDVQNVLLFLPGVCRGGGGEELIDDSLIASAVVNIQKGRGPRALFENRFSKTVTVFSINLRPGFPAFCCGSGL